MFLVQIQRKGKRSLWKWKRLSILFSWRKNSRYYFCIFFKFAKIKMFSLGKQKFIGKGSRLYLFWGLVIDRTIVFCVFILLVLLGFGLSQSALLFISGIVYRLLLTPQRAGQNIPSTCAKFLSLRQWFDRLHEFNNIPNQYNLFGVLFAWFIYMNTIRAAE